MVNTFSPSFGGGIPSGMKQVHDGSGIMVTLSKSVFEVSSSSISRSVCRYKSIGILKVLYPSFSAMIVSITDDNNALFESEFGFGPDLSSRVKMFADFDETEEPVDRKRITFSE